MGRHLVSSHSFQHIRAAQILLFSKNFRQFWFGLESFLGIHFKPLKKHMAFGLPGGQPGLWFVGLLVVQPLSIKAPAHTGASEGHARATVQARPPDPCSWPQSLRPEICLVGASHPGKAESSFHQRYHVKQIGSSELRARPGADKTGKNTSKQYSLSNFMYIKH